MDLSKTRFIDRIFAGKGEMGAMVRTLDWPAAVLGPLLSASRAARRRRISRTTMRSPTSGELRLRNWRRIHSITKEVRVGFRRPG